MTDFTIEAGRLFEQQQIEQLRNAYENLSERAREILGIKEKSNDERAFLQAELQTSGSGVVAEDLALFHNEAEAKKEWSTWEFVKETGKKTWEVAKKYKWWILGAAAVGLTAYGFYSGAIPTAYNAVKTWLGAQAWIGSIGSKISGFFTETIPSILPKMPEVPVGTPPIVTPPVIPSGAAPDLGGLGGIIDKL